MFILPKKYQDFNILSVCTWIYICSKHISILFQADAAKCLDLRFHPLYDTKTTYLHLKLLFMKTMKLHSVAMVIMDQPLVEVLIYTYVTALASTFNLTPT